jgi:hypothetical protein
MWLPVTTLGGSNPSFCSADCPKNDINEINESQLYFIDQIAERSSEKVIGANQRKLFTFSLWGSYQLCSAYNLENQ